MSMSNTGPTNEQSVRDGIPYVIAGARATREYPAVVPMLCERHTLRRGQPEYVEPQIDKLYAQHQNDSQWWDSDQQHRILRTTKVAAHGVVISVLIEDRLRNHLSPAVYAQFGMRAEEAMTRFQDIEGLQYFSAAGITGGSGDFNFDRIRNLATRMRGNTEEPIRGTIRCVAHPYQLHDLDSAILASMGISGLGGRTSTATGGEISDGLTARVLRMGFRDPVNDVILMPDGNIEIPSTNNAHAPVFARESLLLVREPIMTSETERETKFGLGATRMILRDIYGYGGRNSHIWMGRITSDATAPAI